MPDLPPPTPTPPQPSKPPQPPAPPSPPVAKVLGTTDPKALARRRALPGSGLLRKLAQPGGGAGRPYLARWILSFFILE